LTFYRIAGEQVVPIQKRKLIDCIKANFLFIVTGICASEATESTNDQE
jgi:hypothetical protein